MTTFLILAGLFILWLMGDIYNYYFVKKYRHRRFNPKKHYLALQVEFNNIKFIIMSIQFQDNQHFDGTLVVVKKKTGQPLDPQPTLSNISINDANPELFTITQDPSNPIKVRFDAVADGLGSATFSATVGDINFNTPVIPVNVTPELALDVVGQAVDN